MYIILPKKTKKTPYIAFLIKNYAPLHFKDVLKQYFDYVVQNVCIAIFNTR